jgi:SecD/SecF fusion protein
MMRLFARPDIDFMSIRYIMFAITLGLSIAGLALFIGRIPNDLNIDFVGGTAYGGKLHTGVAVGSLREKVAEAHQKQVLEGVIVKEEPGSEGRRFILTFPKTKESRTVAFSNIPEGATSAEREEKVKKRASKLPEPSVEMLYNASNDPKIKEELDKGESRNFVIRTTEKEAELVQACLDELLRDDNGNQLLAKIYARRDRETPGGLDPKGMEVRLSFFNKPQDAANPEKTPDATASPSFVKSLLNRELRRVFDITDEKKLLPFLFEVTGEGNNDSDGKYSVIKVSFGEGANATKVNEALDAAITAFSARPQPDRLENFDSALASETRFRAMWAVLASWTAILVYLWFRFGNWTFGLAAVICLIHDLFFTLGAIAAAYFVHGTIVGDWMKIDDFKLDLPGVAALLTLVGYSCNDTIVVFDRIREVRGKNPDLTPKMINDSINQTLSRTLLASLTVWLVVFVLYCIGGPGVHLFAFIMVVGVIVGTYSSIYIASPLLLMFGEGRHEEHGQQQGRAPTPTPEGAVV